MPRSAGTFELALPPRDAATPAYRWLYEALRADILAGRLRPGARLPGTRDLARQTGLARGTVVSAFDQLASEGYLEGVTGSGTYVSRVLPEELLEAGPYVRARGPQRRPPARRLSPYGRRVTRFPGFEGRPGRAFRPHLPALDLFPTALWAQIAARRWRRASAGLLAGCDALGHRPLREAVADYLAAARGVACSWEEVAIVSGVQEALDLAARILLAPGDRVAAEDPGYPGARHVFEAAGARVSAVPLDEEGLVADGRLLRGARLVYVTPAHQYPLGLAMTLGRRLELLDWARRAEALIFEDDYDSEYRYRGRPVPALQGLDRSGVVLFAGSFNKVLFPSLRLGYLVVPPDLVDRFAAAKSATSRHAQLLEQAILCDFITAGHFGRHLRRMREVYAERLAALVEGAREHLAGRLEISSVEAGLQTAGWLSGGLDGEAVARAAARREVEVIPLSRYGGGPRERVGLQLGFAAADVLEIRRGVRELARALDEAQG